jgi:uncharacterized protein
LTYYLDTSVVAAYYCPEPLSEKVESFLTLSDQFVISSLTEVEMFSAVARKVRERNLSHSDASRILATFLGHLEGQLYGRVPLTDLHYRLARDWIGLMNNSLRTLDALHLAVASSEAITVVTADHGLAKSARFLGLVPVLIE